MLNNYEIQEWTEKYPDCLKGVYKKGIYYYMNELPIFGPVIDKISYDDKRKCRSNWSKRQWLVYLLVHERFEDCITFLKKNTSYFSQFSSLPTLFKELDDSVEKYKRAQSRDIEAVRKRLNVQLILGDCAKPKVKVRVSHSIPHMWNSIQTVVERLCQKANLDVEIILCSMNQNDLDRMKEQMDVGGYKYTYVDNYNIELNKPDIMLFYIANTDVHFNFYRGGVETIRRNVKYIAVVPFDNAVKFEKESKMHTYFDLVKRLKADIFIVAKPIYKIIKDSYANIVQMDSPKFDIIYRKMKDNVSIPESWKKLNGKKIVLWTTIHGHDERGDRNKFSKCVAFDLYVKEVIDYFRKHQNMGLIFRPHPAYIEELTCQHQIWTQKDLQKMKDYFNSTENMVWDDSSDYANAFAMSDALLTDDGTGIVLSYLPTRKPVCILRRNSLEIFTGTSDITQNYYKANDFSDVKDYFEMVERGEDPLFEDRICTVNDLIPVFDGENGKRIADKIIDDFHRKIV